MLTAKIGSPQDLVRINRMLRQPLIYGDGELPTYTLGPELDRLLSPEDRQVGAARLPMPPTLCEVGLSRKRLTLKVNVDQASAAAGRLSLAAWHPDNPDFVDLGTAASRMGPILTFKISARRLLDDEFVFSNGSGNGTTDQRQWVLLLQAERKGMIVAASPIMVPSDPLRAAATTRPEETRDGRIQVGSTPGGSVVVTVAGVASSPAGGLGALSAYDAVMTSPFSSKARSFANTQTSRLSAGIPTHARTESLACAVSAVRRGFPPLFHDPGGSCAPR
jgi:hypothetical protein